MRKILLRLLIAPFILLMVPIVATFLALVILTAVVSVVGLGVFAVIAILDEASQ